jgi:DNA-binding NarL/FixJ family response regulator
MNPNMQWTASHHYWVVTLHRSAIWYPRMQPNSPHVSGTPEKIRVLVVDDHPVLREGIAVLKGNVRKDLADTIRAVHGGDTRIEPAIATQLDESQKESNLTTREVEVLILIAGGNSNRLIASRLQINEATAKTHVKNILAKLGANDRTHAVTLALRRGIIQL